MVRVYGLTPSAAFQISRHLQGMVSCSRPYCMNPYCILASILPYIHIGIKQVTQSKLTSTVIENQRIHIDDLLLEIDHKPTVLPRTPLKGLAHPQGCAHPTLKTTGLRDNAGFPKRIKTGYNKIKAIEAAQIDLQKIR